MLVWESSQDDLTYSLEKEGVSDRIFPHNILRVIVSNWGDNSYVNKSEAHKLLNSYDLKSLHGEEVIQAVF